MLILFDVFDNGDENVNEFCFVFIFEFKLLDKSVILEYTLLDKSVNEELLKVPFIKSLVKPISVSLSIIKFCIGIVDIIYYISIINFLKL